MDSQKNDNSNEIDTKQPMDKDTKKIMGLLLIVLLFLAVSYIKTTIVLLIFGGLAYWAYKKNKENSEKQVEKEEVNDSKND